MGKEEQNSEQFDVMKQKAKGIMDRHTSIVEKIWGNIREGEMISLHTIKSYNESLGEVNKMNKWIKENTEYKDEEN